MARLDILRTRSGNATFWATVMWGQIANDWNTIARLRRSAARSTRAPRSTNVSSPQAMSPSSGVWKPAMHIRVVVLPQPEGPSSVTNSLSLTVKLMSSRTLVPEKDLLRCSTWMSGTAQPPKDPGSEQEHDGDDGDLNDGQGGNRADDSALPGLEHRHAEHLGARFLQEHDRVVVAEQRDEHQHKGGEQRGTQDGQQDPPRHRPPARPAGAGRAVKLGVDPPAAGLHHHVVQVQVQHADRDPVAPQVVAYQGSGREHQVGPEEADAEDHSRHGARIDQGGGQGPPQRGP